MVGHVVLSFREVVELLLWLLLLVLCCVTFFLPPPFSLSILHCLVLEAAVVLVCLWWCWVFFLYYCNPTIFLHCSLSRKQPQYFIGASLIMLIMPYYVTKSLILVLHPLASSSPHLMSLMSGLSCVPSNETSLLRMLVQSEINILSFLYFFLLLHIWCRHPEQCQVLFIASLQSEEEGGEEGQRDGEEGGRDRLASTRSFITSILHRLVPLTVRAGHTWRQTIWEVIVIVWTVWGKGSH